jgi:hypothetical protein
MRGQAFELTEPEPADSVFVTGVALRVNSHTATLVGYQDHPDLEERRIVVRVVMGIDTAAKLYTDLWRAMRHEKRPHPKS